MEGRKEEAERTKSKCKKDKHLWQRGKMTRSKSVQTKGGIYEITFCSQITQLQFIYRRIPIWRWCELKTLPAVYLLPPALLDCSRLTKPLGKHLKRFPVSNPVVIWESNKSRLTRK
jgi:hypothetical protein